MVLMMTTMTIITGETGSLFDYLFFDLFFSCVETRDEYRCDERKGGGEEVIPTSQVKLC